MSEPPNENAPAVTEASSNSYHPNLLGSAYVLCNAGFFKACLLPLNVSEAAYAHEQHTTA